MLSLRHTDVDHLGTRSGLSLRVKSHKGSGSALVRPTRGKNTITDEFSSLAISRQRKYQLRKARDKRCTLCGQPALKGLRCLDHLVRDRELTRKRAGYARRYKNSFSYKMQAEGVESL